ncbi:hypothetical protein DMN91_003050 [Ooceraea biroi]|uniref:Uncharacterized protein n=1 Tax=Ooceraea biroi TaxID=2015173 RepID=A0A3L8DYD1_OOCBI|nr:hypothetical protein DMN91_003050 [Ooceraea biroi]
MELVKKQMSNPITKQEQSPNGYKDGQRLSDVYDQIVNTRRPCLTQRVCIAKPSPIHPHHILPHAAEAHFWQYCYEKEGGRRGGIKTESRKRKRKYKNNKKE